MWIEVPLMPLIYNMLQEALLFNLQIMIRSLSILFNAQDSSHTAPDVPSDHICSMRCWYDGHICRMCSVPHVHGGDGTRFTLPFMCELSLL